VIDYVVHPPSARQIQRQSVQHASARSSQETIRISKRHSFQAITTRRYYPGRHGIELTPTGSV
jgi:hypothetical protein